jgi:thiaminase
MTVVQFLDKIDSKFNPEVPEHYFQDFINTFPETHFINCSAELEDILPELIMAEDIEDARSILKERLAQSRGRE